MGGPRSPPLQPSGLPAPPSPGGPVGPYLLRGDAELCSGVSAGDRALSREMGADTPRLRRGLDTPLPRSPHVEFLSGRAAALFAQPGFGVGWSRSREVGRGRTSEALDTRKEPGCSEASEIRFHPRRPPAHAPPAPGVGVAGRRPAAPTGRGRGGARARVASNRRSAARGRPGGATSGGRRPCIKPPLSPTPPSARSSRSGVFSAAGAAAPMPRGGHERPALVGSAAGWQFGGGLVRGQLHHRAGHRRVLQHGAGAGVGTAGGLAGGPPAGAAAPGTCAQLPARLRGARSTPPPLRAPSALRLPSLLSLPLSPGLSSLLLSFLTALWCCSVPTRPGASDPR